MHKSRYIARSIPGGLFRSMRFLTIAALVAAALLPAAPAAAETTCHTANGSRSFTDLSNELSAAGYPGPWNLHAEEDAYSKASGGSVSCDGDSPSSVSGVATASNLTRTVIVEVGGLGSDADPGGPWVQLNPLFGAAFQFQPFQYSPCGDIDANMTSLANFVSGFRPAHVVLVGHSMGGVLALGAAANYGLSDVIRGVVIADAPVNGVTSGRAGLGEIWFGSSCRSVSELANVPAWSDYSRRSADSLAAHGVALLDISNGYDGVVPLASQQLPQSVNLEFDAYDSGLGVSNHSAVFQFAAAVSAITNFVRSV